MILQSSSSLHQEEITQILCQNKFPEIDSHHDVILSTVSIPSHFVPPPQDLLKPAPTIENKRHKIVWKEEQILAYQARVSSQLTRIRTDWFIPQSPASVSILLDITNQVLSQSAIDTNRSVPLNLSHKPRDLKVPREVLAAKHSVNAAHKALKIAINLESTEVAALKNNLKKAKQFHRSMSRRELHKEDLGRDTELFRFLVLLPLRPSNQ